MVKASSGFSFTCHKALPFFLYQIPASLFLHTLFPQRTKKTLHLFFTKKLTSSDQEGSKRPLGMPVIGKGSSNFHVHPAWASQFFILYSNIGSYTKIAESEESEDWPMIQSLAHTRLEGLRDTLLDSVSAHRIALSSSFAKFEKIAIVMNYTTAFLLAILCQAWLTSRTASQDISAGGVTRDFR